MNFFKKISRQYFFQIAGAIAIALMIIGAVLFIDKNQAKAQTGIPFGGQIEDVEYCCDGSVLLTIGPPKIGLYDYRPGTSKLYQDFDVFSEGPWVLGTAVPGGSCDLSDADCEASVAANTIQLIGTGPQ